MTVTFLPRDDWDNTGAARRGHVVDPARFTRLNIHHTVMLIDDKPGVGDEIAYMRRLRTIRPDLGEDVPYSFVVFEQADPDDVIVAEGRGWRRTGAHTAGENSTSYGVAYAGNTDVETITPGVLAGIRWIGRRMKDPDGARQTLGHRDHKSTACPGKNLYAELDQLQPPFTATTPPRPTPPATGGPMLSRVHIDVDKFLDAAYDRHLDRKPDQKGRAFYTVEMATGRMNPTDVDAALKYAAENPD